MQFLKWLSRDSVFQLWVFFPAKSYKDFLKLVLAANLLGTHHKEEERHWLQHCQHTVSGGGITSVCLGYDINPCPAVTPTSNFQPIRLFHLYCCYIFTYLMANSTHLASSEAN